MFEVGAECPIGDCCTNCTWSKKEHYLQHQWIEGTLLEYCHGIISICLWMIFICRMERSVLKRVTAIMGPVPIKVVCTAEKFLKRLFWVMMTVMKSIQEPIDLDTVLLCTGSWNLMIVKRKMSSVEGSSVAMSPANFPAAGRGFIPSVKYLRGLVLGTIQSPQTWMQSLMLVRWEMVPCALLRRSVLTAAVTLSSNDCPSKCNFRRLCNNYGECLPHRLETSNVLKQRSLRTSWRTCFIWFRTNPAP